MKMNYLFLFCLLASFSLSAQRLVNGSLNDMYRRMENNPELKYEDYGGTPYYNENFLLGKVVVNNEEASHLIRYNAYEDKVEIKIDNDIMLSKKDKSMSFIIDDEKLKLVHYIVDDVEAEGYMIALYDGKNIGIYKKVQKYIHEGKKAVNFYQQDKPSSFRLKTTYFISINNEVAVELESSNSKRLKQFNSKEIEKYAKKNKLKAKKDEDIIELAKYFDTL